MGWGWVEDLLAPDNKKKAYWDARCPYHLCPSNQPFRGAGQPRLKFMQKVSPLVYQYKCKDCSCLMNFSVEQPDDYNEGFNSINPKLRGQRVQNL
jgi:hypothetical protein